MLFVFMLSYIQLLLPILDTIKDKWMTRLLLVVDSGDVEGFLTMLPVIQQTETLAPHTEMLLRKVQMQSFIGVRMLLPLFFVIRII